MSLALAMLVKNAENNILHISRLIDWNVYDEVIIVDNGSTDNSVILLEKLGCKVFSCRDKQLDECRNLYIEHSTADWILVLDSDEYISPKEVSRLMSKPLDKYDAVKLKRYDYYGNGLWSESNLYRLFRRNSYALLYDNDIRHNHVCPVIFAEYLFRISCSFRIVQLACLILFPMCFA